MTIARKQVKNVRNVGRKVKNVENVGQKEEDGKEVVVVSACFLIKCYTVVSLSHYFS